MLIQRLKVSGLLSFGLQGVDLPMRPLTVLIGPNGSGKSNLFEVLNLLHWAPTHLESPVMTGGGIGAWMFQTWAGNLRKTARIEAEVCLTGPGVSGTVVHTLEIAEDGERFAVVGESIAEEPKSGSGKWLKHYSFKKGIAAIWERPSSRNGAKARILPRPDPGASILSQIRDPDRYRVLDQLGRAYSHLELYRDWTFGPRAAARSSQRADERSDRLNSRVANLANVLAGFPRKVKDQVEVEIKELYEGADRINAIPRAGNVELFLVEKSGVEIPASRLSDGTLRYLSLLAILLHPEPPPLVVIDEPELGLHPDLLPHLAKLLMNASREMQLVVSTHSRELVDALSEKPESVVVCSKEEGYSQMERLDAADLKVWLEKYSLGQLWSRGGIGGNRW